MSAPRALRPWLVAAAAAWASGCGFQPPVDASACGEGTTFDGARCVAAISCGAGTHLEGSTCVANTPGLTCGVGTVEQAGACVPTLLCGPGTVQQGDVCVATGDVTCGPGTVLQLSQCVPLAGSVFGVRFGATTAPADGYTVVPVWAWGTQPTGAAATDAVVLKLSRATAGALQRTQVTLGQLGAVTYFTPCSSAGNAACAGPVTVTLALASAPGTVLAESQPLFLEPPMAVGTTSNCDPFANALFFDGQGYIFTGRQTVSTGTFTANSTGAPPTVVRVSVAPASSSQGLWWDATFAAPSGAGPLAVQVYPTAERYPFQPPGAAGLDVTGDGRGCNQSSGRFQVHRLTVDAGQVTEFLATFEQLCEKSPTNVLRGCVKYRR